MARVPQKGFFHPEIEEEITKDLRRFKGITRSHDIHWHVAHSMGLLHLVEGREDK